MPSAFHFVLQFVEQPAELRRVLLGAREFDRPIIRAAEVSVQEAVQFDGRALKSGRAPCEAPPWHSVVFLFHRFWFFLILAGLYAVAHDRIRAVVHGTQQLNGGRDHQAARAAAERFGGALPQHERRHGIRRRSVTFFWLLIGLFGSRTKSTKNPPTFIRRRKVPWRFFVREIALPHIDP